MAVPLQNHGCIKKSTNTPRYSHERNIATENAKSGHELVTKLFRG